MKLTVCKNFCLSVESETVAVPLNSINTGLKSGLLYVA